MAESGGYFIAPTIFDDVRNSMTIAREEIFGPVLSVLTFGQRRGAVQIANDTHYGLASSLVHRQFTYSPSRCPEFAGRTVSVNCSRRAIWECRSAGSRNRDSAVAISLFRLTINIPKRRRFGFS